MITQISASAGSGKTYSLTRLFLKLLEGADPSPTATGCALHGRNHGYSLAEILAATFTNKAATEMKSRVVSSLKEKALQERRMSAGDSPRRPERPQASTDSAHFTDKALDSPAEIPCPTGTDAPLSPTVAAVPASSASSASADIWVERILRHYSALNIRTIDSLLAALVRLSALELDLPPDFEPSFDAGEFFTPLYDGLMADLAADGFLLEEAIRQTGYAPGPRERAGTPPHAGGSIGNHRSEGLDGVPRALPAVFHTADPASLRADLLQACQSLLFFGESKGFTPGARLHDHVLELVERLLTGKTVPRMDAKAIRARLRVRREEVIASAFALIRRIEAEKLNAQVKFLSFLDKCARLFAHAAPPKSAYAQKRSLDECLNASGKGKASSATLDAFTDFMSALETYSSCLPLFKQALQLAPLAGLALEIHSRLRAERFSANLLPALSIPFLAGQALSGEYGVSDALCRLGTRLSRLLLDEFQDTSREQWAAILPLVLESLSTGGGLTYVGDVKQAIYGWRGGDARLFDQAMDEPELAALAPRREKRRLPFNWRSHPAIVAHTNAFFALLRDEDISLRTLSAMLPDHTPEAYRVRAAEEARRVFSQVEQSVPPEKDWRSDPQSSHAGVRFHIAEGDTADEVRALVRERLRTLLVEELLPVWRFGDIAVLVRTGPEGALAAEWLAGWGLPVVTENSFLLAAHPLVNRLISFLAFLDYPPDDLAFWEVASAPDIFLPDSDLSAETLTDWLARTALAQGNNRPPLFQLFRAAFPEAWSVWLAPFHSGAGLMSAYDTLREAINRFALLTRHSDQSPFLLRLLEIAHLAETRGHSSLAAFLAFWRSCRDNEQLPLPEGMNAIRIMTVHKAKGLEFPVVILPFQHQGKYRDPELVHVRREGLDLLARAGKELPELYYPACITDELERLNLLYVAWTRPVYALHAFITRPSRAPSPLQRGLNVLIAAHAERSAPDLCRWEWLGQEAEDKRIAAPEGRLNTRAVGSPLQKHGGASVQQHSETPVQEYATPSVQEHAEASFQGNGEAPTGSHAGSLVRKDAKLSVDAGSLSPLLPWPPSSPDSPFRPSSGAPWRPMAWLPRLKIYRSTLEDSRFTPARRGILAHLCLEHLVLSGPYDPVGQYPDAGETPVPDHHPDEIASAMPHRHPDASEIPAPEQHPDTAPAPEHHPGPDEAAGLKHQPDAPTRALQEEQHIARLREDVRRAVRQGMRLFPLPVDHPEAVAREMEDCLFWFAGLPDAPFWLAHGLREQGVIDARGNMHRVDLLVDKDLHALDYKTGRAFTEEAREEHRRQVRRYMRLVSEARGRPARGTLVYLDERRLEEVPL